MAEQEKPVRSRHFDRVDAVIVLVLIAVILYYFRRILWTHEYIYGELDIRRHFYFFKQVSYQLIRAGELPLWLPQIYCGMPLLAASQVTPFYPVDLALMLTRAPLNMVFNWDLLIHLFAAQIFSYLLFKRMLGNRVAALFGAIWFWNVFFLNSIVTGDALNIRAMLLVPVVLYFVEAGMSADGRPRDFLFGAVALSMQVLCGGLQNTFYTMVAAAAYAGFRLLCRAKDGEEVVRPAFGFTAMIVLGLAISGVQLLPAWEYGRLSVRSAPVQWFKYWAIQPYQLIGYFVPMFEGRGTEHGYFGLAPIALAAFSFPLWRSRRKYFFAVLGAIAIIYSFGGSTAISSFIGSLPIVRGFRGPFRGAIFFNLSMFVLAAGALKGLLEPNESEGANHRWIALPAVGILLVAAFIAAAVGARAYAGFDTKTVAVSAAFLTASTLAIAFGATVRKYRMAAAIFLVSLLVADLALNYGRSYSPASVSEAFSRDWTIHFLEMERAESDFRIAAYGTAHTNYFGLFGFESANGHHPFPAARYAALLPLLKVPKIAALAGVKYYIVYAKDSGGKPYDPPVSGRDQVSIAELPIAPMPRAFLVHRFALVPRGEVLDAMQRREFDPKSEVILERAPSRSRLPPGEATHDTATVISRGANEVVVKTQSDADSILVLTETLYPGWTAKVDGQRADILRANYVFRAVPLTAGTHEIVFRFCPCSFLAGVVASCVGVICWFGWAAALVLRRSARASSDKILEHSHER